MQADAKEASRRAYVVLQFRFGKVLEGSKGEGIFLNLIENDQGFGRQNGLSSKGRNGPYYPRDIKSGKDLFRQRIGVKVDIGRIFIFILSELF